MGKNNTHIFWDNLEGVKIPDPIPLSAIIEMINEKGDGHIKLEELTIDEILLKYDDHLTDSQKEILKRHQG